MNDKLESKKQRKLARARRINALRTFDAFIGKLVSTWSIGYMLAPLILGAILAYFGIAFTFPLWVICLIVGGIAVGLGIYTAVNYYRHIDKRTRELLKQETKNKEDLLIPLDEAEERLKEAEKRLKGEEELSKSEHRLLFWEGVNTFVSSSQSVLTLGAVIILLVSTVFGLVPHTAAILISIVVAIGYGIASALVRGSQVNTRLKRSQALQLDFEDSEQRARSHIQPAINEINRLLTICNHVKGFLKDATDVTSKQPNAPAEPRLLAYVGAAKKQVPLSSSVKELVVRDNATNADIVPIIQQYVDEAESQLQQANTHRQKISNFAGQITALKHEAFAFSDHDKFRVFYHFIMGALTGGSFAYITLTTFSLVAEATPLFWGIIIGVGLIYSLLQAFHKVKSIEREKWLNMDYDKAQELHKDLKKLVNEEITESKQVGVDEAANLSQSKFEGFKALAEARDGSESFSSSQDSPRDSDDDEGRVFPPLFGKAKGGSIQVEELKSLLGDESCVEDSTPLKPFEGETGENTSSTFENQ